VRAQAQAGQNLVELALVMSLLLWFTFGVLDFGRIFYTYVAITNGAREGARYAARIAPNPITSCSAADVAAIKNWVKNEQPSVQITDAMITVGCPTDNPPRRTVIIQYPFQSVGFSQVLGNGSGVIPLRTWAAMPVVNQ
jgi:Flp pilus assembly protein TadG